MTDGTVVVVSADVAGVLAEQQRKIANAYHERNQLVAALARLYDAHLMKHPEDPDWDQEWLWIVCIESPVGQMSWHIHDSELPLFAHLHEWPNNWDGHTTEEKYARLAKLGTS